VVKGYDVLTSRGWFAELQVILLKQLSKGKGKSFGSNLNWRENQVRLKAQLLETVALIYRRGKLFLEPNTTSTCTRSESENNRILGMSQREQ